jgi:hypothetical protein
MQRDSNVSRRAPEARLIEDPKGALERELQVKVSSGGGRA